MTSRPRMLRIIALFAALTLVAAACGDDDDTATGDTDTPTSADGTDDSGTDDAGTDAGTTPSGDDGEASSGDGEAAGTDRGTEGGTADDGTDDEGTSQDGTTDDGATSGKVVETAATDLGEILVSGGFTLYIFTPDPPGETTCFEDCAALWPPLTVTDGVTAGAGVDGASLGTIERPDGTTQVTYQDRPLYFYAPDGPGDTSGQGVGGIWFVVEPSGDIVGASTGTGPGY